MYILKRNVFLKPETEVGRATSKGFYALLEINNHDDYCVEQDLRHGRVDITSGGLFACSLSASSVRLLSLTHSHFSSSRKFSFKTEKIIKKLAVSNFLFLFSC